MNNDDLDRELDALRELLITSEDVSEELRARTMATIAAERERMRRREELRGYGLTAVAAVVVTAIAHASAMSAVSVAIVLLFGGLYYAGLAATLSTDVRTG